MSKIRNIGHKWSMSVKNCICPQKLVIYCKDEVCILKIEYIWQKLFIYDKRWYYFDNENKNIKTTNNYL